MPAPSATRPEIPATTHPAMGTAALVAATTPAPLIIVVDIAAADVAIQYTGMPTAIAPATPEVTALSTTLFFSNSTPAAFPSSPIAIVIFVISDKSAAMSSGLSSSTEAIFLSSSLTSSSIFSKISINSSNPLSSVSFVSPVEFAYAL